MEIMTEEEYLGRHGAGRSSLGEPALHKNKNNISDKQWRKMVDMQAQKDYAVLERREQLREEYRQKVGQGLIRPPSRLERLQQTASGDPNLEATQAARKLLERIKHEM